MAPQWNLLQQVGRIVVDENARCVMSSILPFRSADVEARGLGFLSSIDLRRPAREVVERLRSMRSLTAVAPSGSVETILDKITDNDDLMIVTMVAFGLTDKEISQWVFLSSQTIRDRISRVLEDLGLRNRTQLAVQYLLSVNSKAALASRPGSVRTDDRGATRPAAPTNDR